MIIINSETPYSSKPDLSYDTSDYILTVNYENIPLPCLNRNFICTPLDFIKEYKKNYPNLNFEIPDKIKKLFLDINIVNNNCLILLLEGISNNNIFNSSAWICHSDI